MNRTQTNDYTKRFSKLAGSLAEWAAGRAMVLDGEIAVVNASGITDFQALQNYMKRHESLKLIYFIFDLLALDGEDLRNRPLIERKDVLENMMKSAPESLRYSGHVRSGGKECFAAACEAGTEGNVGKKAGSVYSGTRNGDWIKLKCGKRQGFVVGGYTVSDKRANGISSLLLGFYKNGDLIYAGRAGTGLSQADRTELSEKFERLVRTRSPFKNAPEPRTRETIVWLAPQLIAEIEFAGWTNKNLLRQTSFLGLRTDKEPGDVVRERTEEETRSLSATEETEEPMDSNTENTIIGGVRATHPDKIIFDEFNITKADVIRYYEKVSGRMLPYVGKRILSIVRCPKGIAQTCFFKKHPGPESKGIVTIPVISSEGGNGRVLLY